PPSIATGYDRTGLRAGGPTTFPDVTSNRDPCHGHWMTEPCSRPWHNGPPKWVQVLSRQYTFPPTLNKAYGLWFAVTHIAPPSGTSLSIARTARTDPGEAGRSKVVVARFQRIQEGVDTVPRASASPLCSRSSHPLLAR